MIKIKKPKFDLRNFIGGKLDNNIKYIFIHDNTLEKSFITISVNVGSHSNFKNYDGIAHFLEHMLFMGSKKYPDEKIYFEELNKLGGNSNAYTSSNETVYFFNVFDFGLEKMFDIFSRFFIDPLFNEDSIQREINAVDNEHKKNINSDMWRKFQFMLDLVNKDNTINNFGTGSINTLNKKDIREKLIEFYQSFYTTDNISICIASSKTFNELKKIIDSTFGIIPESKCNNKLKLNKPFYSENNNNVYHLKTLSNIYNLSYIFEIPNQYKQLKSKYYQIFSMILLNKSNKSLYTSLTSIGYLNEINIDVQNEGILLIDLFLTKEGFNNLDFIESTLFQSIDQINTLDIVQYASYYKKILKINFNTIHKFNITELCNMLAVNHYYYNTKNVFKSNFVINKIKTNEKYKNKFIKYINKFNYIKIISSQELLTDKKIKYKKTFEYNTEYSKIDLIPKIIINNNINYSEFDFNNKYLTVKPIINNISDTLNIPQLILKNNWYGGCSNFSEPLVSILLQFNNIKYFNSVINYILTQISCVILNYLIKINMFKSFELLFSIIFSAVPSTSSININISCLNDISKIKLLIEDLNIFLSNINLNKLSIDYVNNLIISLKESYQNIIFLNPALYSLNKIKSYIYDTEYPIEQLIDAIDIINFEQIKQYIQNILNESALTSLIYGNIENNNINKLLECYNIYNTSKLYIPYVHTLEDINVLHPNPDEKSNCITFFYYLGELNIKENVDSINNIIAIVGTRILSQLFFDNLRTKKQLGYLVNMSMAVYRSKYYIIQKIQSNKDIKIVIDNINEFNINIEKYLEESEFDNYIISIKKELLEPEYSLTDKLDKYIPEITTHQYIFNRNLILSNQINKISKKDVISYFNNILKKSIKVIIKGNN